MVCGMHLQCWGRETVHSPPSPALLPLSSPHPPYTHPLPAPSSCPLFLHPPPAPTHPPLVTSASSGAKPSTCSASLVMKE